MDTRNNGFLGSGWAFPISVDARGRIALAHFTSDIEQAIYMILMTPKGQRVMRPEFGCQIHELIFAPNDANTWGLASHYAREALRFWEPRIEVMEVKTSSDTDAPERLNIQIEYKIKSTHDKRSLVFPFYRIPGE